MDNSVPRLLVEEERVNEISGQSSSSSSSAFLVKDKKNIQCYKCNMFGHFPSACKSNNNNFKSEGQNNKCYYCGKTGHYKSKCWFKKNKEQNKSNAFVVSNSLREHCEYHLPVLNKIQFLLVMVRQLVSWVMDRWR